MNKDSLAQMHRRGKADSYASAVENFQFIHIYGNKSV